MKLKIILEKSDEGGFTAYVPSLPGCISEGNTEEEAVKNIQEAIELYLEPTDETIIALLTFTSQSKAIGQEKRYLKYIETIIGYLESDLGQSALTPIGKELIKTYRNKFKDLRSSISKL